MLAGIKARGIKRGKQHIASAWHGISTKA